MAQPTIEYIGDWANLARESGMTVLTVQHPEFAEHFRLIRSHPKSALEPLSGLEPFSLILRNDSGEPRGYISVRYTYTFLDGSIHHGTEMIRRAKPGDVHLISQASTAISPGISRSDSKDVEQYRQLLANCVSVKISLDAVQLADESLVGPDEGGLRIRIGAEQRAANELRNSSHTRAYLESLRRAPRAPWSVELGNAQPEFWYTEARREIAARLLGEMK